jgi:hypothetical protein
VELAMKEENLGALYTIVYSTSRRRTIKLLGDLCVDQQLITELTSSDMIDEVSRINYREVRVHIKLNVTPQHADEFIEATLDRFVARSRDSDKQ